MEYTQWVMDKRIIIIEPGLNPCCNGIYSMRVNANAKVENKIVLILVVMEYTQWVMTFNQARELGTS